PVALPRRSGISLYLRRRTRSLLLTAARLSRNPVGAIHARRYSPRVPYRKELRSALYGLMRTPGVIHRPLARSPDASDSAGIRGRRTIGADRIAHRSNSTYRLVQVERCFAVRVDRVPVEHAFRRASKLPTTSRL